MNFAPRQGRGARLDTKSKDGMALLHHACLGGHLAPLQYLRPETPGLKKAEERAPALPTEAADSGYLDVVKYLIEQAASLDASDENRSSRCITGALQSPDPIN